MEDEIKYCDTIDDHSELLQGARHCKECDKTTGREKILMEAHLFHDHGIHTRQSNFVWDDIIISRYFTSEGKYFAKCKECEDTKPIRRKECLQTHMEKHEKILKEIKKETENSWMSKHCSFSPCLITIHCRTCNFNCKTVNGTNYMKRHLEAHPIREPLQSTYRGTRSYNVDATIQHQPVAEENYASTSYDDNRHRQTFENQGDQQRYAPTTPTQYLMSYDNLHRVAQHGSETGPREQMIQPEQGTAGFNIEQEDEMKIIDFQTDYSDLLQWSD